MGDLMTGHSAKATALSWLDKAHVSRDDRCLHIQGITRLAPSEPWSVCTVTSERAASSQIAPGQVTTLGTRAPCSRCVCMTPAERDAEQSWYCSDVEAEELVGHQPDGTAVEPLPECAVDDVLTCAALDAAANQEGEGSPGCSGSTESSESSSSSSSDDDMDEDLDQCHEDGRSLVHQVRESCLVYQQIKTKTLHLLPLRFCSDRFICGRSKAASHKPFKSSVEVQHWRRKQCRQGKPLRDMGSMTEALDRAVKRARREA